MKQTIESVLTQFNFSSKEIAVYRALLSLGASVVSEIAEAAEINRSTAYVVLDSLTKRGVVSVTEQESGVKTYAAIEPAQLVTHLESIAAEYAASAKSARSLIPELEKEQKKHAGDNPKVRLFEGAQGVKTVYEDVLSSLETIRSYASAEASPFPEEYYERLTKKGIAVNVLFPDGKLPQKQDGSHAFSPEITVYDEKISLVSPNENFALIIESPELAEMMKKAFDLSWQKKKKKRKYFAGDAAFQGAA